MKDLEQGLPLSILHHGLTAKRERLESFGQRALG